MNNSFHVSLSPHAINANDLDPRNVIPGLLNPHAKLHIVAFNVRTLCQVGARASLARTLESHAVYVCCVFEMREQYPITLIHSNSPCQYKELALLTLRVSEDLTATFWGVTFNSRTQYLQST